MKLVIIDGQGGKMGRAVIEQLKKNLPYLEIYAIGTNSIATSAMLKAGADYGATGENPVIVGARTADIIIGPIGIVIADALMGEITPSMLLLSDKAPLIKFSYQSTAVITISPAVEITTLENTSKWYAKKQKRRSKNVRTVEFKMERPGLVSPGDKVKIIEREGTSSYSYIIDPAVAMSGCFAARDRIKSEYGIVKDVRENARGFYVVVDFDED